MAIELSKGKRINLSKGAALGEILINLNWTQGVEKKGIWGASKVQSIDLDLGAFVELADGTKHVVQALGNSFGSLNSAPYVALDGDDRTGEASGGENLRVNGKMFSNIKRMLVYTFIYEGVANWQQANGIVTIKYPGGDDIIVRMDEYGAELIRYDLDEDYSVETAVVVAELYRHGNEWKFNAIGSGFAGGLSALCKNFGINA
jgi:tellurite resistance protein TerA